MANLSTGQEIGDTTVDFDSRRSVYYSSVKWQIHYSHCIWLLSESDAYYYSSPFNLTNVNWRLEICSDAENKKDNKHWTGLYLRKYKTNSGISKYIAFTFGILNSDGTICNSWCGRQKIEDDEIRFGVPKFLRRLRGSSQKTFRKAPFKFCFDKGLTIFCVIKDCRQGTPEGASGNNEVGRNPVLDESEESSGDDEFDDQHETLNDRKSIDKFCEDMKDMLLSEQLYDVKIIIKDEELKAHKTILAARSPVFSAMFEHNMAEKNSNVIEISDCKLEVFKEFLHYLYTGKVEEISKVHVCGVYVLADKYDVKQLKEECVAIMKRGIALENFCDIISLAIKYKESKLLKTARYYFVDNAKNILETVQWQSFIAETPTVANELFLKTLNQ